MRAAPRGRLDGGGGTGVAATCGMLAAAAVIAGCTIPITAQTLTGGALNAGALLFVDRYNQGPGEGAGAYAYYSPLDIDTLAGLFDEVIADANRRELFPEPAPMARVAGSGADTAGAVRAMASAATTAGRGADPASSDRPADGIVLADAAGRAWRPDDPPRPETFPQRQWTPAATFDVRADAPEARGDTLRWIVTHRGARQAAFLLVPHERGPGTRVMLVPYEPPSDILLSVPGDHAQRNAVEALHEAFYFAAVERYGRGSLVRVRGAAEGGS